MELSREEISFCLNLARSLSKRNSRGDRRHSNDLCDFVRFGTRLAVLSVVFRELDKCGRRTLRRAKIKGGIMNWDQIEGKWKQTKGKVRERWGRLTDDDIDQIAGQREQLVGRLQERYGLMKEAAEEQVNDFLKAYREEPESKSRRAGQP